MKSTLRIVGMALLGIVFLIVALPFLSRAQEATQSASSTPDGRRPYETTAPALRVAYDANEVATDRDIDGRRVWISGEIHSIDKDAMNNILVTLETGNPYSPAVMAIVPWQESVVSKLSKTQSVTILCQHMKRWVGAPRGDDCELQ